LETLLSEGTQASQVDEMLTRARLYELVDYEGYNRFDASVFDVEVPTSHP
ncbi:MAG: methylisocitrate lyase, partial [Brachybacterium tyrofermentans]